MLTQSVNIRPIVRSLLRSLRTARNWTISWTCAKGRLGSRGKSMGHAVRLSRLHGAVKVYELCWLDHVAWVKYQMTERLKSKAQSDSEWWEALNDETLYPGRGYLGPGECGATLKCARLECAGGRRRLHMLAQDAVAVRNTESESHVTVWHQAQEVSKARRRCRAI